MQAAHRRFFLLLDESRPGVYNKPRIPPPVRFRKLRRGFFVEKERGAGPFAWNGGAALRPGTERIP